MLEVCCLPHLDPSPPQKTLNPPALATWSLQGYVEEGDEDGLVTGVRRKLKRERKTLQRKGSSDPLLKEYSRPRAPPPSLCEC